MSFREVHQVYGIRCDKGGCDAVLTGAEMPLFEGYEYYEELAVKEGWSIWVSRTRRAYCPKHGPSKSARMWLDEKIGATS